MVISTAKKEHADVIICGCRGLGKLRRTFTGTVSDYIVHHSHVPVVVCRHPSHKDEIQHQKWRHCSPGQIGNCENSGISGWKPKNCEVWIWEDCLKFRVCYKEVDAVNASRIYIAFATSITLQSSKSDYLHRDIYSILFLCLNFSKIEYMFLMFTSVPYLLLFNVTE